MFYDRRTGRMYFTKSGSNQLHWRELLLREPRRRRRNGFSSARGAGGVDWDTCRRMFMVDGHLYTS